MGWRGGGKGAISKNKDGTSRPLAARLQIAQTWPSKVVFSQMSPVISSVKPFRCRLSGPAPGHQPIPTRHANHLFGSVHPRRLQPELQPPAPATGLPPLPTPAPPPLLPEQLRGRGQRWAPHAYADDLPPPSLSSSLCFPASFLLPLPPTRPPLSPTFLFTARALSRFPAASARPDAQFLELGSRVALSQKEACARPWNRREKGRQALPLRSSRRSSLRLAEQGQMASKMPLQGLQEGSARRLILKCLSPPKHQINFSETHIVLVTSKCRMMIDDFVSPELQCVFVLYIKATQLLKLRRIEDEIRQH